MGRSKTKKAKYQPCAWCGGLLRTGPELAHDAPPQAHIMVPWRDEQNHPVDHWPVLGKFWRMHKDCYVEWRLCHYQED